MISVKRTRDGKVFTSDMSKSDGIYEIHFCTSYTEVMIQEEIEGNLVSERIICEPVGTKSNPIDLIAIKDDDLGFFITK
jgi:hypothetical protein